jgi:predicted transcriptional regulator
MGTREIHKTQLLILRTLRHSSEARYTDLMKPTGMDSDVFKFHLRKLVSLGYVTKNDDSLYKLTATGKEFSNNLSRVEPTVQKQPKLSVIIVARRAAKSQDEYLVQKRLREPFFGHWSFISGPVQWGESFEDAAGRELLKQAGLRAKFEVNGFYRKTDYLETSNDLLEDKLFAVVEARDIEGDISNAWSKGENTWMDMSEYTKQDKYFDSTLDFISMIRDSKPYISQNATYCTQEY